MLTVDVHRKLVESKNSEHFLSVEIFSVIETEFKSKNNESKKLYNW